MNWLKEYILESQLQYPSISQNPTMILEHLLFVNGNGVDIENGRFYNIDKLYRKIFFEDYYKTPIDKDETIERLNNHPGNVIEENYESKKRFNNIIKKNSDEELWDIAHEEFYGRYNDVEFITEETDLFDSEYHFQNFKNSKYDTFIQISPKFYKQYYINENSDIILIKTAIALSEATIKILEYQKINPKSSRVKIPRDLRQDEKTLKRLEKDINRLKKLLK